MRQGQCSQVAGNLFWGKRWVIEGQRAWEGRGSRFGQVAAGVAPDIRPVSRASRSLYGLYGIVDCHFVPRIVTGGRAEVAPLWASEAVGETINCAEGTNWGR